MLTAKTECRFCDGNGKIHSSGRSGDPMDSGVDCLECEGTGAVDVDCETGDELRPYVSTTAERFAPGNFVTTWNPEIGRDAVGVTRAIEDPQEANPRVLVKWLHDLSQEWVRSEYLYLAKAEG